MDLSYAKAKILGNQHTVDFDLPECVSPGPIYAYIACLANRPSPDADVDSGDADTGLANSYPPPHLA
jgi:hypothetical protein